MRRDYSDSELRALIMDWLVRHGRWGAYYFPFDTLVNNLSHVVRNDGKRIRKFVKELLKEGYLLAHKGREAISLNHARSREITEYVKRTISLSEKDRSGQQYGEVKYKHV
jgi:glutamate-1-semialdehyde aminotransferase